MCGILFRWRKASKCKKLVRRVQCRLKFLKIKRRSIIQQSREDIVELLRNGKPETAFSHVPLVEELFKDQNLLSAYDLLEHFCEFVILHLPYIRKHKNCPNDINEAVSTLIFAAAWCGDLPELQTIRKLFEERHGSKFIRAITELHPGNHVNCQVKEKLRLKSIPDNIKLSLIVELAKDHALQAQHPESNKRLGSNLLLLCGNDKLHREGFLFEGMTRGDYGSSWLAEMLSTNDKDIQSKLRGQLKVGNSVQVEDRYESKLVCNKVSDQGSFESFGSNHSSATSFGNKVETRRTSSHSELLVQFNERTFNLDEVEEIHINTLHDQYVGDKTIFLFNSTLLSERNNYGFSGASLLVSSHCYSDHYTGKAGLWNRRTCLVDSCKRKSSNSMMLTGISNLKERQLCHSCLSPYSSVKDINCELYYGKSGNLSSYQKHIYHGTCPQHRHSRTIPSEYPLLLGLSVAHSFKQEASTEVWRKINYKNPTKHSVGDFQDDILIKNSWKLEEAEVSEFQGCCASSCGSCSSGSSPFLETKIVPHQSYPRSMTIAPERVKKTTNDYSLQSDSYKQFQNSKGMNSSSFSHVHPKLPDYDEFVAKFKALKQEHQQREAACCKAIKTNL